MALPPIVKAEVKLTTGGSIAVDARELEALQTLEGVGLVAALFTTGDPDVAGRWILVDARAWKGRGSVSVARAVLLGLERAQPWLAPLREHVDALWPRFLEGWKEVALEGHEGLIVELERALRENALVAHLPRHEVLAIEHRRSLGELVETHGEADAGRLVQDLLAYIMASAGYARVTNNPVGVPDFVLEGRAEEIVTVRLRARELARFVQLCEAGGEAELGRLLRGAMAEPEPCKTSEPRDPRFAGFRNGADD